MARLLVSGVEFSQKPARQKKLAKQSALPGTRCPKWDAFCCCQRSTCVLREKANGLDEGMRSTSRPL